MRAVLKKIRPVLAGAAIITTFGVSAWDEAAAQTASNVICNGCVNSRDVKNGSLTGVDIKNGTVGPADLHPKAKPGGADRNAVVPPILETDNIAGGRLIVSVTISLPAAGQVVVNASGSASVDALEATACYLAKTPDLAWNLFTSRGFIAAGGATSGVLVPLALTDVFTETAAGPQTYNVYCLGEVGAAAFLNMSITGIYVPSIL